ncbi:hypothetical protein [Leptospira alexanderi]|uniref:hypothetical protein n=1 Tax=Leptospira alexanderi TaxID=100053 RepID=UPI0002885C87|nr:hypothetical protein [Leptospira alexanderi]
MITRSFVTVTISGDDFDVGDIDSNTLPHPLILERKIKKGDSASRGRYKGGNYPYGLIDISTSHEDHEDYNIRAFAILDWTLANIQLLKDRNCDHVSLYITSLYETQCNLAFDLNVINKISEIGRHIKITFALTCGEDTEFKNENKTD